MLQGQVEAEFLFQFLGLLVDLQEPVVDVDVIGVLGFDGADDEQANMKVGLVQKRLPDDGLEYCSQISVCCSSEWRVERLQFQLNWLVL